MKLPLEIKTKNKLRDFRICKLYLEDTMSASEIAGLIGVTVRQINRILYKNREVLKTEKNWEKIKRIHWLKTQIKLKNREGTKRDIADLYEQLRKETEGDKPLIDQSKHNHFTRIDVNQEEFRKKSTKDKIDIILGRRINVN